MKQEALKGKRVTVFGLGLQGGGTGTVEFLSHAGAREIIVTDKRKKADLLPSLRKLEKIKNVTYVLGQHRPEDFTKTDLVIKNPGIPWTNEYIRMAETGGIPVHTDAGLFFEWCCNPIIGVTGTKGKTTTASMIAHILSEADVPVRKVGIGQGSVLGALADLRPKETVVFELSSWRLSGLSRVRKSPHVAVFTSFFPDHMNYYKDISAYREDKSFIYRFQKKGDVLIAGAEIDLDIEAADSEVIRFSAAEAGEDGAAFFREDEAVLLRDGEETVLFRKDALPRPDSHYVGNALAASLAAFVLGVPTQKIASALRTFSGVPHRMELIREASGVAFYNDTTASVPEAAIAALESFPKPPILIAGGSDKKLAFDAFAEAIVSRAKRAIFLEGAGTDRIRRALSKLLPEGEDISERYPVVSSMDEAVSMAYSLAEPGDVVLLSPGAASFGLFKNEFDRGDRFRDAVARLPGR